jgi:CRISPR-associated endonuclease/helicase Cas3
MTNKTLFIKLEPRSISGCASLPDELSFKNNALQHQVDVFEKSRNADIIINIAPTGTGKTDSGLAVLLHEPKQNAIYIAPTNALVEQQKEAAEKFVKEAGLPHIVKSASAKEVKAWAKDKVGSRPGEKLYNVLRNPATVFSDVGANQPILLITNPDIFYYATFFAYNKLDRVNLASGFYSKFATVIFDEFHLYDAKQLVGLLFYLAYSHIFGFFKFASKRRVVLLTATPEPACAAALQSLEAQGVRVARIDGETCNSHLLPSQTSLNLELRSQTGKEQWLTELANEVVERFQKYPDRNGAVILDAKDHINRLADLLYTKGLGGKFGRITGSTPSAERKSAAQKPIILATSTVDVGFNFERNPQPKRQNLDWLIFSARDRFSFWQRLGRVGRVLGKAETNIDSEAIAYLSDRAWDEGLASLDCSGGRAALTQTLDDISCLEKPFLQAYWRSEAFLEIARPLLEIEEMLTSLSSHELIAQLFDTLKMTLGGSHNWDYYRHRMRVLRAAEQIAQTSEKSLKTQWKFIKGGQAFVKKFLKVHYPTENEELTAGKTTIEQYEQLFSEDDEAAKELKTFAEVWSASYAPLFKFRSGLFNSLPIRDPKGLLLDESDETVLDPIHLLRYYEFEQNGKFIEVTNRAKATYELSFRLRYLDTWQNFINTELNKLSAFPNCRIIRKQEGAIAPTPLLKELEQHLIAGVIICPIANAAAIYQLRKERIVSYPITVVCNDMEKEYCFLPELAGILAIAMKSSKQLRLPDDECFIV